jgi:hypothetical protein
VNTGTIISLVLSGIAIAVAALGWWTNRGAIKAEQADRKQEAADRAEQLALLRRQVATGEAEQQTASSAELQVMLGPSSGGERDDGYQIRVANLGPDIARNLLMQAIDPDGKGVGPEFEWPSLAPHAEPWVCILEVPRTVARAGGCGVMVHWRDRNGVHGRRFFDLPPVSPLP